MNQPGQTAMALPAKERRFALPALAITLVAILFLYRDTAVAMVSLWARSETFTHAFLVPPITLWLIWRVRDSLAPMMSRPSVLAIVALGGTGLVWLVSELATVGVMAQFALTTMLVLAVPAVLGMQVARRIAFPLLFLYFAVPFGEFALPTMMEWTANFTVIGLRLTGIPVYREGLQFIIPSGSWSVIEACSGVRYLIASLTVGTLFAYLTYRSPARRLIFVAVSFVVPLIANWMRAYIIVMLGHLSGNTLAVGVDHLIYGWVFFGLVIAAMFWIGSRWREDEFADLEQVTNPASPPLERSATNASWVPVFAAIALLALFPIAKWQIERNIPPPVSQLEALGPIPGWSISSERVADWRPHFENPSATLETTLGNDKQKVGLYVGYYRNQDSGRKLVSSVNVLVRSTDQRWARVSAGSRAIALGQESLRVRTAEIRSVGETRLVVWHWYWIDGHLTDSDFVAKAYTALSRLVGRGDDSAVIVIYADKETAGGGDVALDAFAHVALSEIDRMLQRTRDAR
jgi:exosortase A